VPGIKEFAFRCCALFSCRFFTVLVTWKSGEEASVRTATLPYQRSYRSESATTVPPLGDRQRTAIFLLLLPTFFHVKVNYLFIFSHHESKASTWKQITRPLSLEKKGKSRMR
jgi:hypothetical protein